MNNYSYVQMTYLKKIENKPALITAQDLCQTSCFHPEAVVKASEAAFTGEILTKLSDFYKLLGDPTRLRILSALAASELCVCDLAETMQMNQSAISQQLRILKAGKLVTYRRKGKMAIYRLDDEHVSTIISSGLTHIEK
jgi:ArsR family transcriptional regulator